MYFCQLGFYEKALNDADIILQLNPKYEHAYSNKANALLGQLLIEEAKTALKKGIKELPESQLLKKELIKIDKNLKMFALYEKEHNIKIPNWYGGPALACDDARGVEWILDKHPPTYAHECLKARKKLLKLSSSKIMW